MAGYCNFSMSNNAVAAYADGERPKSKWTRSAILSRLAPDARAILARETLDVLRSVALARSSWHHTSSHYNATNFYVVDPDICDAADIERLRARVALARAILAREKQEGERREFYARVEWLDWGGTRRHPVAYERKLDRARVVRRGQTIDIYDGDKLVATKRIYSRGTTVVEVA